MTDAPTKVLYDGWCVMCARAAERLRRLDRGRSRLEMIDLRQEDALVREHQLDAKEVRRVMHAITPDGEVLVAMDALRATMRAVNRGWMIAWTRIPLISWACDRFYLWFANNRLRFFKVKDPCDDACSID
jgi:predicted DCC family thiol-disulfide oxidoreductase YuxK